MKRYTNFDELNKIIDESLEMGFVLKRKNKHLKLCYPNGKVAFCSPTTTSDRARVKYNTIRDRKRALREWDQNCKIPREEVSS